MAQDVHVSGVNVYDNINLQVESTHRAARVSLRPPEKGLYGSYQMSMTSGTVAAAMSGPLPIWEMRWFPTTVNALIRRLRFSCAAVVEFTVGQLGFDLYRATSFSVLDATGAATAPTILGKSQAKSTRFAATQIQSSAGQAFCILNTANTGLTAGTKTLDNNPLVAINAGVPITAGTGITQVVPPMTPLLDCSTGGEEPIELQANEGLVLRAVSVPATGTWVFSVNVEWDEIDPARYFG